MTAGQLEVVSVAGLALAAALSRAAGPAGGAEGALGPGTVTPGGGTGTPPGPAGPSSAGGEATSITVKEACPTSETLPARSVAWNPTECAPTSGTVTARPTS